MTALQELNLSLDDIIGRLRKIKEDNDYLQSSLPKKAEIKVSNDSIVMPPKPLEDDAT